ncbi:GNAT family N-acetyltransferase [Clostridium cellulovorans]|uniref:GCN5-related N-acetyltransferase n=1 Tax=Clostridium cellulovorans (strain ATCC 35296 / DSM 3052 / OCM 3 / 743B) TaxID=573061 RepID=D9SRF7_CLOC7|nr:GNAT family protein [Clostridium cellulovorans]ADL52386.1 GCN5-related N-acetyltransferase [Clostridium cellulovorans 743B]
MYFGEKIRLRAYEKEDAELAHKYFTTPETRKNIDIGIPYPISLREEEKWLETAVRDGECYTFAIETLEDSKYIGGCGINNIDRKNSVATVGISIGDEEYKGKGYGTDAMKTLVNFIFNEVNVNKVKLNVFSFNERAIKSYEKVGFKKEGVLRQEIYRFGKYYDVIVMGILKEEFLNK